jgi:hypothetical protein
MSLLCSRHPALQANGAIGGALCRQRVNEYGLIPRNLRLLGDIKRPFDAANQSHQQMSSAGRGSPLVRQELYCHIKDLMALSCAAVAMRATAHT